MEVVATLGITGRSNLIHLLTWKIFLSVLQEGMSIYICEHGTLAHFGVGFVLGKYHKFVDIILI